MSIVKIKYIKVLDIHEALVQLGNEKLNVAYEIAKNIRICRHPMEDIQGIVKELQEKLTDKDAEGNPVYETVPVGRGGKQQIPKFDETNSESKKRKKEFEAELKKIENDIHELNFHKIPYTKIKDVPLQGTILAPLLEYIIVDSDE